MGLVKDKAPGLVYYLIRVCVNNVDSHFKMCEAQEHSWEHVVRPFAANQTHYVTAIEIEVRAMLPSVVQNEPLHNDTPQS